MDAPAAIESPHYAPSAPHLRAPNVASLPQPRLAPAPAPAFAEPGISPDGTEIAFVSGGDIWTVPAAGGEARLLVSNAANDSRPMYSPDRKQLAFVSTRTGGGDVYVLTLATGDVRRMTFDDGADQLDGWSRDGRWLYFFSSGARPRGRRERRLPRRVPTGARRCPSARDRYANEFFSAVSPDGKTLAMSARGIASGQWWRRGHSHLDEAEIWLRDLTAADTPAAYRGITTGGAKDLWPMWAADGASLFFVSDRTGAENIWQSRRRPQVRRGRGAADDDVQGRTGAVAVDLGAAATRSCSSATSGSGSSTPRSGNAAAVPIARIGAPAGPAAEQSAADQPVPGSRALA